MVSPSSLTNVRLLSGVPFNNDNKHTRWFTDVTSQTNYFLGKTVDYSSTTHNYVRNESGDFITVNKRIEDILTVNYMMFQNSAYTSKWFYAFVTKLEYVNPKNTRVYYEIDVIQTWMFNFNLQPSYIVREHMGDSSNPIANADGTPATIFHQDEGLDYGSDYDVVNVEQWVPYGDSITNKIFYLVIVTKQPMHTTTYTGDTLEPAPIYNGGITPLNFYVHPFRFDSQPVNTSLGTISMPLDVLKALYTYTNSVNDIVSLYITDYIGFNTSFDLGSSTLEFTGLPFQLVSITNKETSASVSTIYYNGALFYNPLTKDFGNKYSNFNVVDEPKLYMHPYCVISLEDFRGNRVDLKPEYIYDTNLKVTVRGALGSENNVSYSVDSYNAGGLEAVDQQTVSIETALIDTNPNDIPIIVDMLSAYFQGNKNTLRNQKQTLYMNTGFDAVGGAIGAVASIASGNLVGTLSSIEGGAKGVANDLMKIQGINAKIKDINNQPPQLSKMGSNTAFDYGNERQGLYIVKRQIKDEYIQKLTDFFNMFGYKSNRVKVPNLNTRASWNFVQTQTALITGDFNNEDKTALEEIFNKGITLWHVDDVGNYTLDNGVI